MVKDVNPINPKLEDQQSMQALKQYGGYIFSAILVVLASYFGWQFWQNHGGRIDTAASNDFAKIQNDQNNIDALTTQLNTDSNAQNKLASSQQALGKDLDSFIKNHDNSIYTWQALMLQAKQQADKNDFKSAATSLQKASQLKVDDAGLQAIATLRYAQVLLADNQLDNAIKALQTSLPAAFEASKQEILGDIAMQKNDKTTAIASYQKAWQLIETRNNGNEIKQDRALLRLKMENLGLSPKQPDLTGGILASKATRDNDNTQAVVASSTVQNNASGTK